MVVRVWRDPPADQFVLAGGPDARGGGCVHRGSHRQELYPHDAWDRLAHLADERADHVFVLHRHWSRVEPIPKEKDGDYIERQYENGLRGCLGQLPKELHLSNLRVRLFCASPA